MTIGPQRYAYWGRLGLIGLVVLGLGLTSCGDEELRRGTLDEPNQEYDCSPDEDFGDCTDQQINALLDQQYEELIGSKWEAWLEEQETVLNPNTHVFDNEDIDRILELTDDQVVLPLAGNESLLEQLQPFQIITSAHPDAPFLRRILELEARDDQLVITTVEASLEEVVIQGSLSLANAMGTAPGGEQIEGVRQQGLNGEDLGSRQHELAWAGFNGEVKHESKTDTHSWSVGAGASAKLDVSLNPELKIHRGRGKFEFDWQFPSSDDRNFCGSFWYSMSALPLLPLWSWYWGGGDIVRDGAWYSLDYRIVHNPTTSWNNAKRTFERRFNFPSNMINIVRDTFVTWSEQNLRRPMSWILPAIANKSASLLNQVAWLVYGPLYAGVHCAGELTSYDVGVGLHADMTVDPTISIDMSLKQTKQATSNMSKWRMLNKGMTVLIGWLPVWLELDLNWVLAQEVEVFGSGIAGLGKKGFTQDWYYGRKWVRGENNNQPMTMHLATGNKFDWINEDPYLKFKGGAKLRFTTGPELKLTAYKAVGFSIVPNVYAEFGFEASASTEPTCPQNGGYIKAGGELKIGAEAKIPFCSLDDEDSATQRSICGVSGSLTLIDTCSSPKIDIMCFERRSANLCPPDNTNMCMDPNAVTCVNCSFSSGPSVNLPEGINDVDDALEIDAIFLERPRDIRQDGATRKIEIESVTGLSNCRPGNGTVEKGCPELLQAVDFTTCNPDDWDSKVGLVRDLSQFSIKFKEDAQVGDVVRVYRQGVSPNQLNDNGERCLASGNFNLYLGDLGSGLWAVEPVAEEVYNSADFRVEAKHLNQERPTSN